MKKVKLNHDIPLIGYRVLKVGEEFKVLRHNKRFVYIEIREGLECRITRKDCTVRY